MTTTPVSQYYDDNTLPFLRWAGSGLRLGAIHRQVWAPGVRSSVQAFEYLNQRVLAECGPAEGWQAVEQSGATAAASAPELKLLDLGCGVGGTATWLAQRAACSVHGVTLSSVQVSLARARAARLGLASRCTFETADMTALSGDVQYHAGYAIESLIHVADAAEFFSSAARVLLPGAVLFVCDDFLSQAAAPSAAKERAVTQFRHGWRAFGLRSAAAVKRTAQRCGFELQSETNLTPYLHCVPPWLTRPAMWGLSLPLLRGNYWDSLRGSTALQDCVRNGWTEYRALCWVRQPFARTSSESG